MFNRMQQQQCQSVHCFQQQSDAGDFRAYIVLHNTHLGPALGGCRLYPYANEQQALSDAMRLAQGMSYKSALAQLPFGGGKAVIIEPHGEYDRKALFHWFGDCVEQLGGRYITAMDLGTQVEDMDHIAAQTQYVASHSPLGDPSHYTCLGVLAGMRAALEFRLQKDLSQARVAIQGLGHVVLALAEQLIRNGAQVWAADPNPQACLAGQRLGVNIVEADELVQLKVDVYSPCALGASITPELIAGLNSFIVAGCANNQLADESCGELLRQRNILYVPDFLINAGGLMYAANAYRDIGREAIYQQIEHIYFAALNLFLRAQERQLPLDQVAIEQAEEILHSHYQAPLALRA